MRWDWQIGRVTPLQRTGRNAVDIYDIDGFLTARAQVRAIETTWQASALPHPRTVCYLDLAWEDYRPDATPGTTGTPETPGGYFPAGVLGALYYGYPEERWVDLRQLDALKPMLRERISMCARKGFDAVELDDIDSFDPPSTTGFQLTPGDAQNFLAYAFNEIHLAGMTALWKNSPYLSWWGRQYADGAVVEECYLNHACFASPARPSTRRTTMCAIPVSSARGRGRSVPSAAPCTPRRTVSRRSSSTSAWTAGCSTRAPSAHRTTASTCTVAPAGAGGTSVPAIRWPATSRCVTRPLTRSGLRTLIW